MIILTDANDNITGYQLIPNSTSSRHVVADISESLVRKIVGRASVSELGDIDSLIQRIDSEDAALEMEARRKSAQKERDSALESMTHDFGDGRIMQVRPFDEANIIRALEIMESEGLDSVDWVMQDNTKHSVTAGELREALRSGRLQGLSIWNDYNP